MVKTYAAACIVEKMIILMLQKQLIIREKIEKRLKRIYLFLEYFLPTVNVRKTYARKRNIKDPITSIFFAPHELN